MHHSDTRDRPTYYQAGNIQPIDFWEDWNLNPSEANVIKYLTRAGIKDSNQLQSDLRKARFYLKRSIELDQKNILKNYFTKRLLHGLMLRLFLRKYCIEDYMEGLNQEKLQKKILKYYLKWLSGEYTTKHLKQSALPLFDLIL